MRLFQRLALGCAFVSSLSFSALSVAGTGEFCTLPNAQGVQTSYQCDVKFTAQSAWLGQFNSWLAANKTSGKMACFAPGNYPLAPVLAAQANVDDDSTRFVLRGVIGTRLCAPTGGAVFESKVVNADGSPLTTYAYAPTLQISGASNVAMKGLTLNNSSVYSPSFDHHVTRALWVQNATGIRLVDSQINVPGKQGVVSTGSAVYLTGTTLNCAYFCLAGDRPSGVAKATFTVANSQFSVNRPNVPNDDHTALWTDFSDFFISDTNFNFTTGQGFVSGNASTVDWVNLSNISITGTTPQGRLRMFGWIPTHPNYNNVQVSYTGVPPISRAYLCTVGADNPGCDTGHENAGNKGMVFRTRANASSAFLLAPLPPTRVSQMLFLNGDNAGVELMWVRQTLQKNGATLSNRGIQAPPVPGVAWGGWLDAGDVAVTGSFTAPGLQQVVFFNSDVQGGAFSIRSISGPTSNAQMNAEFNIDWTPALAAGLGGWHDANDKLLAGDFLGLGRSQLMFFNADGAGGAFSIRTIEAATAQLVTQAEVPWTPALSTSLVGWVDAGDKLVAGDFAGLGRAQLLFINTTGGTQGAASLRKFDAASNSFQIIKTVPWNKIIGTTAMWTTTANKTLVGDFLGLNKDQLLIINPNGTGVALSFWSYDATAGSFNEVYKMNWAPDEITNANVAGFVDGNDWQVGF
jgi:hypothetical protein